MVDSSWHPFENGATLGQTGSELGRIVRDEEHALGARITLEHAARTAPFAITCGIYGNMVHTRFFGPQNEADIQYDLMKDDLGAYLESASVDSASANSLLKCIHDFIEKYP